MHLNLFWVNFVILSFLYYNWSKHYYFLSSTVYNFNFKINLVYCLSSNSCLEYIHVKVCKYWLFIIISIYYFFPTSAFFITSINCVYVLLKILNELFEVWQLLEISNLIKSLEGLTCRTSLCMTHTTHTNVDFRNKSFF